jgi:hypothetical protein
MTAILEKGLGGVEEIHEEIGLYGTKQHPLSKRIYKRRLEAQLAASFKHRM